MKFAVAVTLIVCILSGCSSDTTLIDQAMTLRQSLLTSEGCTFGATVTADYGDAIYTFQMDCTADAQGNLNFTVVDPESINGITGSITTDKAALTFDDKVLAFPLLADGQLSPVSAPWIFLNTLKSGYLIGCGKEDTGICMYIDDSYAENPLHLQIYTDSDFIPSHVEIVYNSRCILSADIRNFTIL